MPKKHSFNYVKLVFEERGYIPLFDKYNNNCELLPFICEKGHKYQITLRDLKSGRRCGLCSPTRKITFSEAKEEFIKVGYTPLFREYRDNKQKLIFRCDKGHENRISLGSLKMGRRCIVCRKEDRKLDIKQVKKEFIKAGYLPLFESCENVVVKLPFICDKGHNNKITLNSFRSGHRCSICARNNRRTSIKEVKEEFISLGYTPLFKKFRGQMELLPFRCDKGHDHKIRLHNLKRGQTCGICSHLGISKAEREIKDCFNQLGIYFEENTKKIIHPYELDLFFPEKKVAVEYCGLYWHSEISGEKDRKYHFKKRKLCEGKGIRLITVFEDEYLNRPHIVLSRIKNALGVINKRIYARNCLVKRIDNKRASQFLRKYHLQGYGKSKVSFGIFYQENLVGVMTGGNLSRPHVTNKKVLEMKRLCFLPEHSIVGGASKLLKSLIIYAKKIDYEAIRSYQDMRYGNPFNSVYDSLNFNLISETKYTPHYVIEGHTKRVRNQALRKTPEERKTGKTEWQLRRAQGYDRIWDCGHRTYEYGLEDNKNNINVTT